MSHLPAQGYRSLLGHVFFALTLLTLSGCASKSYVVLLPNDDGTTGKVVVSTPAGTTLLEKGKEGALLSGPAGKPFAVSDEKIAQDFGAALAASPKKPVTYLLYFDAGGTKLTSASQADIPKIIEEVTKRPAPDISIIGHTDTTSGPEFNARLALSRARQVAEIIKKANAETSLISIESHGEKNLLIPTPDNTDEPRNRRVEVTIR